MAKGGTINRFTEYVSPRSARAVALKSPPSASCRGNSHLDRGDQPEGRVDRGEDYFVLS